MLASWFTRLPDAPQTKRLALKDVDGNRKTWKRRAYKGGRPIGRNRIRKSHPRGQYRRVIRLWDRQLINDSAITASVGSERSDVGSHRPWEPTDPVVVNGDLHLNLLTFTFPEARFHSGMAELEPWGDRERCLPDLRHGRPRPNFLVDLLRRSETWYRHGLLAAS